MDVYNNFIGRLAISQRMMFDETNTADVVFLKIYLSFSDFIYIYRYFINVRTYIGTYLEHVVVY